MQRTVPAGDDLQRQGLGNDYLDNQRRAELLFQQLLSTYPQSDKIGDAAYQLGDIYESRAYRQYRRAASTSSAPSSGTHDPAGRPAPRGAPVRPVCHRPQQGRTLYQEVKTHDTPRRIQEADRRLTELVTTLRRGQEWLPHRMTPVGKHVTQARRLATGPTQARSATTGPTQARSASDGTDPSRSASDGTDPSRSASDGTHTSPERQRRDDPSRSASDGTDPSRSASDGTHDPRAALGLG